MLKFLLGRSGSGKTDHIIKEIETLVSAQEKAYLLVPEQQVYISESMLADLPPSSALCFEVISFSRLCEIIFSRFGGITERPAGRGARNLVMWQSLREIGGSLEQYKGVKTDAAFTSMMLNTVDELRANSITSEECEALSQKTDDPLLRGKLSDIAAIYTCFEENLKARLGEGEFAAENKLARASELLRNNSFLSDCNVYVDSFTSFTGEEREMLEQIIKQAKNVCVSLTYDKGSKAPHFDSVSDTYKRLSHYAKEQGIEHCDVILDKNTRTDKEELRALERELWNFSITDKTKPDILENMRGNIEMHNCLSEYEEIYRAGLSVLYEHEGGVDYSEMAVIMRDPESKKGMIEAVFESLGIPYFLSDRTDLSTTAPARLLISALRCIAHNFNLTDVMTLLKTGLLGIDDRDADLFEDYCYTWNINGKQFTQTAWSMNPDGYTTTVSERGNEILDCANRVRNAIIPPLERLKTRFSVNKGNTIENCRALYSYLAEISLSQKLSSSAEDALGMGDLKGAGEMLRLYDHIVSTLTDIASILGETQMSAEELCAALEIMLRHTDIGSVPAMNDCVTVGSAATLRVENIRTAILIGLCEGEFPANFSESGILSENDKRIMDELGIKLSSREDTVISDELFYVYRAMTKPSDKLILSTSRSSVSGRALNPSSAWNRVRFLFPYIKVQDFDLSLIRSIHQKYDTADGQGEAPIIDPPADNNSGDVVEIDPLYVRMIFGDRLHLSKSQISSFAECPYKYWCEYVLRLREQKQSAVSYADSGTVIHYVLENLLKKLCTEDGRLEKIDDGKLIEEVDSLINEYISGINCPLPPSIMYNFSRIRDLALIMAKSIRDEFDSSLFRIVAFEKPISDRKPDALKPMEIRLDESGSSPVVSLGGVIDRIDCYEGENRKYIRIIDYKTGAHKYDVSKISSGADLQLPAYLFTATIEQNHDFFGDGQKDIFPASALFLSAEESEGRISPIRSGFTLNDSELLHAASPELDPKVLGMSIKKDGTPSAKSDFSEESILNINTLMQKTISDTARNMYSGKAPRTPSREACGFCSLKATCPVANKD